MDRATESQCFPVDPRGTWDLSDPTTIDETYCGRGRTRVGDVWSYPVFHCVAKPAEGCDPCMIEPDEIDAILLAEFDEHAEIGECPADFGPEQVIRGCFAEALDEDVCCWTSEVFYDREVCQPGPQTEWE